tara:strand:- start:467 stop:823 length:357 start_codon:yes stop_codon:yes gene_type:complete
VSYEKLREGKNFGEANQKRKFPASRSGTTTYHPSSHQFCFSSVISTVISKYLIMQINIIEDPIQATDMTSSVAHPLPLLFRFSMIFNMITTISTAKEGARVPTKSRLVRWCRHQSGKM